MLEIAEQQYGEFPTDDRVDVEIKFKTLIWAKPAS